MSSSSFYVFWLKLFLVTWAPHLYFDQFSAIPPVGWTYIWKVNCSFGVISHITWCRHSLLFWSWQSSQRAKNTFPYLTKYRLHNFYDYWIGAWFVFWPDPCCYCTKIPFPESSLVSAWMFQNGMGCPERCSSFNLVFMDSYSTEILKCINTILCLSTNHS